MTLGLMLLMLMSGFTTVLAIAGIKWMFQDLREYGGCDPRSCLIIVVNAIYSFFLFYVIYKLI